MRRAGGGGGLGGMSGGGPILSQSPDELRVRLAEVLRLMPANDPHRPIVQRLHDQLSMLPYMAPHTLDRSFLNLIRAAQAGGAAMMAASPQNQGAHPRDIEALPTRVFESKATNSSVSVGAGVVVTPGASSAEEQKERNSCLICLCEYENGDVLRTLVCFHSFHKDCVDQWFKTSQLCPTCRTPISSPSH